MQERYIATVDLGSHKTALCVAKVTGADTQILFYRELPSEGVRYSYVYNPKKSAAILGQLIEEAEKELGIKILKLVVGLPRYDIRTRSASARTERTDPDSCITQDEINMLKELAQDGFPLDDNDKEEIYGAIVQSFSADELIQQSECDVVGATASTLDGNFKFFIGARKASRNIDIMLNDLNLAAAAKVFTPHSTAEALLAEEEKSNGVGLIELGAGVTSLTIFQGGLMRYYCSIPFGARNLTADIKYECGLKESLAENIKLAYGACMPGKLQNMEEKILRINDDETGLYDDISIHQLSEIINCRMEEILDAIFYKIKESGYAERLRNGLVITGGGANLANLCALIRDKVGCSVRIAYPRTRHFSATGCSGIYETGAVTTAGLILEGRKKEYINCTIDDELPETSATEETVQEPEVPKEPAPETAPEIAPEAAANTSEDTSEFNGSLFPEEDEEEKRRLREEKKKREKEEKEEKERKKAIQERKKAERENQLKKLGETFKIKWVLDKAKSGLEVIGNLYDSTEKTEE